MKFVIALSTYIILCALFIAIGVEAYKGEREDGEDMD